MWPCSGVGFATSGSSKFEKLLGVGHTHGYKVSTQVQDIVPVEVTEIIEEYPPLWYFSHTPRYNKLYLAISPMNERYDHAQNPLILLDKLFSSGG
jgi:hypothetical protein